MRYSTYVLVTSFILLFIIGCKNDAKKKNSSDDITVVQTDTIQKVYEPSDEDIQEYGIIEAIEDGGYPFFVVTVNFVERALKQDFNLNIEAISLDAEKLHQLRGKYATIFYTSELENSLSDLHYQGTSLFGEYAPEMDNSWKQITGTLQGANKPTPGDLPGKISVVNDKEEITFERPLH